MTAIDACGDSLFQLKSCIKERNTGRGLLRFLVVPSGRHGPEHGASIPDDRIRDNASCIILWTSVTIIIQYLYLLTCCIYDKHKNIMHTLSACLTTTRIGVGFFVSDSVSSYVRVQIITITLLFCTTVCMYVVVL